jgi:bacillithiol system protein YtxJ
MSWQTLRSVADLDVVESASADRPQLLFKHSTRCSISSVARRRLEGQSAQLAQAMDLHFLDLIAHRDVSNAIAERLGVAHESPQTILLYRGQVLLDQSHMGIDPAELITEAQRNHA